MTGAENQVGPRWVGLGSGECGVSVQRQGPVLPVTGETGAAQFRDHTPDQRVWVKSGVICCGEAAVVCSYSGMWFTLSRHNREGKEGRMCGLKFRV